MHLCDMSESVIAREHHNDRAKNDRSVIEKCVKSRKRNARIIEKDIRGIKEIDRTAEHAADESHHRLIRTDGWRELFRKLFPQKKLD